MYSGWSGSYVDPPRGTQGVIRVYLQHQPCLWFLTQSWEVGGSVGADIGCGTLQEPEWAICSKVLPTVQVTSFHMAVVSLQLDLSGTDPAQRPQYPGNDLIAGREYQGLDPFSQCLAVPRRYSARHETLHAASHDDLTMLRGGWCGPRGFGCLVRNDKSSVSLTAFSTNILGIAYAMQVPKRTAYSVCIPVDRQPNEVGKF
ncbi:uncharacterized protein F4822DRAFT_282990 [Hypoxylon trugodes]|uniref:uncharacterized protein n=1 Tax=Hypoxylon trugodes TaxID=326681 RepID=UPI00219780D1|nr:uncharacterized protein F4822DRAFT_282990 [Hypoxylon trugodes]KAI1387458.1 hypothetical protein F4822DRAFT_282990 [Hypoxylon trugodes]